MTDAGGLSVTDDISVTVAQTLTTIAVTPGTASVGEGGQQQFAAAGHDQFGNVMASQPAFAWAVSSGPGSVDGAGLYAAPGSGVTGAATVTAASGSVSGGATVSVVNGISVNISPDPVAGTTGGLRSPAGWVPA